MPATPVVLRGMWKNRSPTARRRSLLIADITSEIKAEIKAEPTTEVIAEPVVQVNTEAKEAIVQDDIKKVLKMDKDTLASYVNGHTYNKKTDPYFRDLIAKQLTLEELQQINAVRCGRSNDPYVGITLDSTDASIPAKDRALFLLANHAVVHNCNVDDGSQAQQKFDGIFYASQGSDPQLSRKHHSMRKRTTD
ncbi:uncharacterized protein BYT42DRAFT_611776 [Radiomyces spectabilis]|uniref:uncharacterized protein n=1 Tax=Radiomyces spectabilis TaxID=64574 RepID=UPI00222042A2|nr:uncharacterized protein BYT42DRAFT_611776 [Radiomyces spectabilis]KAI8388775.1 hypothetical protein BYT42DRAFT_611776 [Radiomyces spectabilis]